ncbi:MAG: hypothetical protein WC707_01375 [Candidatus Babeliaceae bacterium]|jgi:hypothetical protein
MLIKSEKNYLVYLSIFLVLLNSINYIKSMDLDSYLFNQNERHTEPIKTNEDLQASKNIEIEKLVPDDIVTPTLWKKLQPKTPQSFGLTVPRVPIDENAPLSLSLPFLSDIKTKNEYGIRKRYRYTPKSALNNTQPTVEPTVDDKQLTVFIIGHGTWGRKTPAFYSSKSPEFRHVKKFAAWYSTAAQRPLELLSFKWSGFRTDKGRMDGAAFLHKYIEAAYKGVKEVVTFGHSHACNVFRLYGQEKNAETGIPVKLEICIAGPQRPEERYASHAEQVIALRSSHDIVDKIGSLPEGYCDFMALNATTAAAGLSTFVASSVWSDNEALQKAAASLTVASTAHLAVGALQAPFMRNLIKKHGLSPKSKMIIAVVDIKDNSFLKGLVGPTHSGIISAVRCLPDIVRGLQSDTHYMNYVTSGLFKAEINDVKDADGNIQSSQVSLSVQEPGKIFDVPQFTRFEDGAEVIITKSAIDAHIKATHKPSIIFDPTIKHGVFNDKIVSIKKTDTAAHQQVAERVIEKAELQSEIEYMIKKSQFQEDHDIHGSFMSIMLKPFLSESNEPKLEPEMPNFKNSLSEKDFQEKSKRFDILERLKGINKINKKIEHLNDEISELSKTIDKVNTEKIRRCIAQKDAYLEERKNI